ncbi:hypothetical protein BP6252_02161 [Coleophoma cylindrospora]|uniref:C2H2-type domain-containing protein n=1 Tax=Coleophoma cylindrospora TaxID=1849047 RepID=A0A3D8SEG0_9HELO|nr:hypothetical protein BP6252_02161 [Coleophoma cylindrospora]
MSTLHERRRKAAKSHSRRHDLMDGSTINPQVHVYPDREQSNAAHVPNMTHDIVDLLASVYRRVSISAITVICVCGAPEVPHDPAVVRSFRYQALSMVNNINKINRTVCNPFGDDNPYRGDEYYLNLVASAFSDLDTVGRQLLDMIEDTSASPDNLVCDKIISALAYILRQNSGVDFRSLPSITADPLPPDRDGKIAIIRSYFDYISSGRVAFQEAFSPDTPDTVPWAEHGFQDRTAYVREFLVPMLLYQCMSGAHFLRWLIYSWRKLVFTNLPSLESASLIYDPESSLRMKPSGDVRGFPNIVWASMEVDDHTEALITNRETLVTGQSLRTKQLIPPGGTATILPFHPAAPFSIKPEMTLNPQVLDFTASGLEILASIASSSQNTDEDLVMQIEEDGSEAVCENSMIATSNKGKSLSTASATATNAVKQRFRQAHLICPRCLVRVSLPKDMQRHLKSIHGVDGKEYYCPVETCKRSWARKYPFDRLDNWRRHVGTVHRKIGFKDSDCIVVNAGSS